MTRASVALIFAFAAAACGSNKNGNSICDTDPPPVGCGGTCDPGAAVSGCDPGFHCRPDGTCDAVCTPGGAECDPQICTQDGKCEDPGPGGGPNDACPAVTLTAEAVTPSISLLLDQSGSMYDQNPTRYSQMRDALVGTTGVVTQLASKAYFGAMLYTCDQGALSNPAQDRALNNANAVRQLIDSKLTTRGGNTPTPEAIDKMVETFALKPPPADSPPVIVLATDGLPNTCPNNQTDTRPQSVQAARAAFAAGIPVYVLAMNIDSAHFQELANAGQGHQAGQPNVKYYPVNDAQQMKAAFDAIIGGVISCDLKLTSKVDPFYESQGIVTVNGMQLQYGTEWTVENGDTIKILGDACTRLKNTANAQVQATFPCGGVVL